MIWHPTKWWRQLIGQNEFVFQTWGSPPGLLDSGQYCGEFLPKSYPCIDPSREGAALVPSYYQCLSCCCTPAKCEMPQEILMTISGFGGTLSSVDRPAAYGYGPGNVCDCPITWRGAESYWQGYTTECCECRQSENFYWWPRWIRGGGADGGDMCDRDRNICDTFPHLCSGVAQPTKYGGRIAARFINPCTWPCTDFVWSDHDTPGALDYSLVTLTDCARAPEANARLDYQCLTQDRVQVVRDNDSYLPPPGFRGPQSVNLLPLCENKFWNDPTYYRFCVSGGFWCQPERFNNDCYCMTGSVFTDSNDDFFWGLSYSVVQGDGWWPASTWCLQSPTRCKGPVPVEKVRWKYYRPEKVLISQPSAANCSLCPGYGYGYGSSYTNYGHGQDWYDPNDDGNCIGKTDVAMEDFNQTFMLRARINEAPPMLQTNLQRSRPVTPGERLITAQLLYQVTRYSQVKDAYCDCVEYDQGYWRVDYPCESKISDPDCKCLICDRRPGQVAPKLRAFYKGATGSGASINFTVRNYCPTVGIDGFGPQYNGGPWYIASTSVDKDDRGGEYVVGDKFSFGFYESPLRGGENLWPGKAVAYGTLVEQQEATVTRVDSDGAILDIALDLPENFGVCQFVVEGVYPNEKFFPRVPLYWRELTHRYAVGVPGTGYVEGDVFVFDPFSNNPDGLIETGGRFYPYLKTSATYESLARATVTEVDSDGGVVDWYMCGAQNTYPWLAWRRPEDERKCKDIQTGKYYDLKYENRCEYNYVGFLPVRYAWSGFFDHQFHEATYCEHAWAEFSFNIDQISVKNTVNVLSPPMQGGKTPRLKIATVAPAELYGEQIEPLQYQNYEISAGPNIQTTSVNFESTNTWYKNHAIPVPQGTVRVIEVIEKGSGYVKKIENQDGTYRWEALQVATYPTPGFPTGAIKIRGVADDMRNYMKTEYDWPTFCRAKATIICDGADENDPDFGGIASIEIEEGEGGMWYFAHAHDHVWFAKVGSNWYFELAEPATGSQRPQGMDYSNYHGYDCWHASRDNWGEMHHYDGFYDPFPSGYHEGQQQGYTYYSCGVLTDESEDSYAWPTQRKAVTNNPGMVPAGDPEQRWGLNFCPYELLERQFKMILVHPCAACAKELGIAGGQTCWNMGGYGDTTYAFYPNQWAGTGTAFITRLSGDLIFTISLPTVAD